MNVELGVKGFVAIPAAERFDALVEKTESCWMWRGVCNQEGYGRFRVAGTLMCAHRFAYEHFVAPIPDGLTIDHLCRNPGCVNPDHLEPTTMRENILRGNGPAGTYARRTHCSRGHEYTPENTLRKGGTRRCRRCGTERKHEWRLSKRGS